MIYLDLDYLTFLSCISKYFFNDFMVKTSSNKNGDIKFSANDTFLE